MGFRVKVQHVLHTRHKLGAHLGNAPLLFLPRLETVFFNRLRSPSWDMEGTSPQLHHLACQEPEGCQG